MVNMVWETQLLHRRRHTLLSVQALPAQFEKRPNRVSTWEWVLRSWLFSPLLVLQSAFDPALVSCYITLRSWTSAVCFFAFCEMFLLDTFQLWQVTNLGGARTRSKVFLLSYSRFFPSCSPSSIAAAGAIA